MKQSVYKKYVNDVNKLLNSVDEENLKNIILQIANCTGTVYMIGNGASASMASHFSVDLMKNTGIKTVCFHDPAFLTCYSNDFGYDKVFSQKLLELGQENDVLLAISSSGNSKNIINAAKVAKKLKMKVIGFSGFSKDNKLNNIADYSLYLDGDTYGKVEISHNVILHYIIDLITEFKSAE